MNLLVDFGNSCLKWCLSNENEMGNIQRFQYSEESIEVLLTTNLLSDLDLSGLDNIIVCCVASLSMKSRFYDWAEDNLLKTPIFVESANEMLGVKNAYKIASKLGNDRWLSILFVHQVHQMPVCVIDCGTAITIDVVLESGQHAGGLIAPGYMAQIAALDQKTNIIENHHFDNQRKNSLLQNNTELCVEQGCRLMSLGFLKDVVNKLTLQYGDSLKVIITGGDSENFVSDLPADWHYQPDLLFRGLQFFSTQKSELSQA